MTYVLAIGTRKGLWLAQSEDRHRWTLDGPHLAGSEVAAVALDDRNGRQARPRVIVGVRSEFWGPALTWSDDLGGSWHEPEQGAISFPADTEAALARVWQLRPDPDREGVVWAGCEPTSLWRSDDFGESFSLIRGLWDHPHRPDWAPGAGGAAVHTVIPDPTSTRVLIAMSTGGVYASEDGATGWTPFNHGITVPFLPDELPEYGQCVHKVDVDPEGTFFAQNHGGVFRSTDRGTSWQSIAAGLPSDFGFPVLASPRVPGTVWVVPLDPAARVPPEGRLRVHRTTDAGATWTALGAGLPDSCWTCVLRDAACVDPGAPTGIYLGTRTGSVFASPDEGDSFVTVADQLPDVLVVRAATLS
jgi:hypothetical protein